MSHQRFVSVYRAKDEITANIVKGVLEAEEIETIVEPTNASNWLDGVIALAEGFWGDVLVPECDAEKARRLLNEYAAEERQENQEESK